MNKFGQNRQTPVQLVPTETPDNPGNGCTNTPIVKRT